MEPSTPTASSKPACESPEKDFFYRNSRLQGGTYYRHEYLQVTREQARAKCESFGGHLPMVRDQVEYENLLRFLGESCAL